MLRQNCEKILQFHVLSAKPRSLKAEQLFTGNKLVETGILSILLNWHYRYNVHSIHDCLLSGRRQITPSCMCSSAVASQSQSVR